MCRWSRPLRCSGASTRRQYELKWPASGNHAMLSANVEWCRGYCIGTVVSSDGSFSVCVREASQRIYLYADADQRHTETEKKHRIHWQMKRVLRIEPVRMMKVLDSHHFNLNSDAVLLFSILSCMAPCGGLSLSCCSFRRRPWIAER